jgi:hypothetical protein
MERSLTFYIEGLGSPPVKERLYATVGMLSVPQEGSRLPAGVSPAQVR